MTPRRGEFWWIALDPVLGSDISKTRPCLVITHDVLNQQRRTVVVVPLSSSPRPAPPILVPLQCAGRPAVAVVDQIRAVTKQRLRDRIGVIEPSDLEAVEDALREILRL